MNNGRRIAPDLKAQIINRIKNEGITVAAAAKDHGIHETNSQISTLTDLRIRGLIADTEFIERRTVLQSSLSRLQQSLQTADSKNSIEPEQLLLLFSNRAISWFRNGDDEARRMLLATVSSNLFLKDKKLSIQAKKPFQKVAKFACLTRQLQALDDIRTTILEGWKSYELEAAVKIMIQGQMVSV